MSCYNPYFLIPEYFEIDKKTGLQYLCVDPETGVLKPKMRFAGHYVPEKHELSPDGIKVPCGKCLGCKLDYSRTWSDRMVLELDAYRGDGIFVTLTYNNEYIPMAYDMIPDEPVSYTLKKDDLQKFFKRLRKDFKYIRYYASGEYGTQTQRPHYHCIIFGLSLNDFPDRRIVGRNELGQDYYTSSKFQRYWSHYIRSTGIFEPIGFVCLSDVSYKTCSYVSRYTAKKVFGTAVLPSPFAEPEFSIMSRNPGIGLPYLTSDPSCLDLSKIYLNDGSASVKIALPKYFLQQMKWRDPAKFQQICEDRKRFAFDKEFLKLQGTTLSYLEQLELEQEELIDKTKILFKRKEV